MSEIHNNQYDFHHRRVFRIEDFVISGFSVTLQTVCVFFFSFGLLSQRDKKYIIKAAEGKAVYFCYNVSDNRN